MSSLPDPSAAAGLPAHTQAATHYTLITLAEAAQFLRVSNGTLYLWSKHKLRPAVRRIGHCLLFDRETIMRLLEGGVG
jgi:hypothetical protein